MKPRANRKKINTIFLDMDGVIVDLVGKIFNLFDVDPILRHEVVTWDGMAPILSRHCGKNIDDPDIWEKVSSFGMDFWATAPWTEFGREVYEFCRTLSPNVVIMSTPTNDPMCAAGKMMWIKNHLPNDAQKKYNLTPCKSDSARRDRLLIDDGEHNVAAYLDAGGPACLFPATWNSTKTIPNYEIAIKSIQKSWDLANE